MEMQTRKTARLELQPLTLEHADRLFELFQDHKLARAIHESSAAATETIFERG